MRHGKRFNHLGRTAPHRKAMLSNMASSLILHKRISTTVAKAKALRQYVEPLITKSKTDSTHNRRVVFSYLQDKETVRELFDEVSEKISERPGGYTRIIKTGNRLGDNAEMCIMELVDYNELLLEEKDTKKTKTRRSRRGGKKSSEETAAAAPAKTEAKAKVEEETVAEEKVEAVKAAEVVEEVAEPKVEEVTSKAETKVEEEPKDEAPEATDEEESKKE
jgi:large subunit ribosomal protein L17